MQISLSAQDETKQPYSPLIAFLPGVILPLQISYCIAGLLFFFLAGGGQEVVNRGEEGGKGNALSLLSFLENMCVLKIDLPPGFPVPFLTTPKQG